MNKWTRGVAVVLFPAVVCVGLASLSGCGPSNNGLPSQLTVTLPDGSEAPVTLGSGVISLADTRWTFYQAAPNGQGAAFVTIRFGSEGQLEAFEDNTIAANIFGDTILFDGARYPTAIPGVSYAAATYGAESSDATGFAFEGRLTGFAAGLEAASGTASAVGEFDVDDPDTIRGTFSYKTEVTLISIPEGNQEDEFNFVGRRVVE
ncbi:MAG: hypothetical protein J5J06_19555 [Phycisphaerae bacterium]|nr:hypothetical protein [Phycisphaerae bacterium]